MIITLGELTQELTQIQEVYKKIKEEVAPDKRKSKCTRRRRA